MLQACKHRSIIGGAARIVKRTTAPRVTPRHITWHDRQASLVSTVTRRNNLNRFGVHHDPGR